MNKKGTKKLSGALAATTVLTSVAGATPAFAKGTDWDAIYKTAYEAMVKAEKEKTQESINAARKAIGDLAKNKQLFTMASTFSEKVDAVQQGLFNDLYALMYVDGKPKKSMTQEEINKAKALVTSFATYDGNKAYIASWSSAIDVYQQEHIIIANRAVEKAINTKNEKDIQAARKEVKALATSGDEIVKKEAARLDVELAQVEADKVVEKVKDIKTSELKLADKSNVEAQLKEAKDLVEKVKDEKHKKELKDQLAKKETTLNNKFAELEEETHALVVKGVKAINANEIQVTFSKAVDYASATNLDNYVVTINKNRYGKAANNGTSVKDIVEHYESKGKTYYNVDLSSDGKTITFKLNDKGQLDNGFKYGVDVKGAILDKATKEEVAKYGDTQKEFRDNEAPQLEGVSVDRKDNRLQIKFNEPINNNMKVTVDGEEVEMKEASKDPLDYTVKTKGVLTKDQLAVGTHKVVIYNVQDIVKNNGNGGNKVAIMDASYEIKKAETPLVESLEQGSTSEGTEDFNTFRIYFSEAVEGAKIVVKKGNTEFANETKRDTKYDVYDRPYIEIKLPVSVQSPKEGLTYLYEKDANSTELQVTVQDFKNSDKLYGEKTIKNITLKRDSKTPRDINLSKNKITEKGLVVALNRENVKVDFDKLTVKDKKGVSRAINKKDCKVIDINDYKQNAILIALVKDGNNNLNKEELEALSTFTVSFDKEALEVATDIVGMTGCPKENGVFTVNEATNKLKNAEFSTKVDKEDKYAYKAVEAVKAVDVKNNVITIEYTERMGASAAEVNNYRLDNLRMPAGTKVTMDGTNKKVTIVLPKESVKKDMMRKVVVTKDVLTETGSYVVGNLSTKEEFMSGLKSFKDNTKPVLKDAKFVLSDEEKDRTTKTLRLTFDEKVKGIAKNKNFIVIAHDGTEITVTASEAKDKNVTLTLDRSVNVGQTVKVKVVPESESKVAQEITDINGNKLTEGTIISVSGTIQAGSGAQ